MYIYTLEFYSFFIKIWSYKKKNKQTNYVKGSTCKK